MKLPRSPKLDGPANSSQRPPRGSLGRFLTALSQWGARSAHFAFARPVMGRAGLRADPFESLISRGPNQILDLGLCPGHTNLCLKGQKLPTKAICPRSAIDDESSPARTRRAAMPSLASSLSPSEDLGRFKV